MKQVVIVTILIITILLGCENDSGQAENTTDSAEELLSVVLSEKPENGDSGLHLYRNPHTKKMVTAFYANMTENEAIVLPILTYADIYNIPLPLAFSLSWAESSFQPRAFNRNAVSVDRGLFQLNSKTFPFLKVEDFYNPEINARYGLAHLRFCLNEGKSEIVALAMYNAGTYGVKKGTPYSTLKYVARIMDYKHKLEESFQELLIESARLAKIDNSGEDS